MSLVIRLKAKGSKNHPAFRIVVMEARSKRDGRSLAEIGYYNPGVTPPLIQVDQKALEKWLKTGAKLSNGLAKILK